VTSGAFLARRRAAVSLCLCALLAACGDDAPGGSGRWDEGVLVLEGSPGEMGWWQGHLLRDRIRALAQRLPPDVIDDASLRAAFDALLPHAESALPERLRAELHGIARGSGVPFRTLLLMEIMGDLLRYHPERRQFLLEGDVRAAPDGTSARWRPQGEAARAYEGEWLLVERRPVDGTRTLCVAWPGSLSGPVAVAPRGAALSAAVAMSVEHHALRLPFRAAVRATMERTGSIEGLPDALQGSTAHRLALLDPRARRATVHVHAIGGEDPAPAADALPHPPVDPPYADVTWDGTGFRVTLHGTRATVHRHVAAD
jgi:hypothetical protein